MESRLTEAALHARSPAAVLLLVTDVVHPDGGGSEDDAVLGAGNPADRLQCGAHGPVIFGPGREEVDVPCRPQFLFGPYPEESRTLQGESIHLTGGGEAVQEALHRVALEHEVEFDSLVAGQFRSRW